MLTDIPAGTGQRYPLDVGMCASRMITVYLRVS